MAGLTLAATAAVTALLCLTAFLQCLPSGDIELLLLPDFFRTRSAFAGRRSLPGIMLLLIRTAAVHRHQNEPAALRSAVRGVCRHADEPTPGAAEEDNTTASIGDVTARQNRVFQSLIRLDVRYLILTEEQLRWCF
ncbi:MAG: hypothetical protein R3C49_15600 [Planctomycetaceae bacterium]